MNDTLIKFLKLVQVMGWRHSVPKVWNEQYRTAITERYVKIGFGGLIELTDAGKTAARS